MHFRNSDFKPKIKTVQIPQKRMYDKFYIQKRIIRAPNYRRKFIKNLLPKKCKENM